MAWLHRIWWYGFVYSGRMSYVSERSKVTKAFGKLWITVLEGGGAPSNPLIK